MLGVLMTVTNDCTWLGFLCLLKDDDTTNILAGLETLSPLALFCYKNDTTYLLICCKTHVKKYKNTELICFTYTATLL